MLARLIQLSIRHASLVIVASGLLLVFAGVQAGRMPVDVFPELNAPTVVVMTEAGGLAADEVEQYVTFPIESAVNGLSGTRRVRSASTTSLSMVWVEFDWGEDIFRARQLVAERLAAVRETLPEGVHTEITPITSITGEIMLLAVSSPDGRVSPLELRAFAEFDLRSRILAVPGVAQVVAIGGQLPQYQIDVRQDDLAIHGLSIKDVVDAARQSHSTASAGYMADVESQEMPIRQVARAGGLDDIRQTLVRSAGGAPVTIGRVADVRLGAAPSRGLASDRGLPAVVVSVQKSPGTNTLELTERIDRVLDSVELSMPEGMVLNRDPFRAARFIQRSVNNVVDKLIKAGAIVAIILILFLLNVRATVITLTALPLSIAVALLLLWAWGLSINVMTLGGLAVAIGELVDDAIIDVENVLRRLSQNASLPIGEQRPTADVVFSASNEIRSSIVFATVIICMVFVPLLFLQGLEGRFFRPLGIAYITSILASLVVALTVTPALCRVLLRGRPGHAPNTHDHGGRLVRVLKRAYAPALSACLRRRGLVLLSAGVLTGLSLLLASTFGTSFLPAFKEGTFTVFLMAPPGTSLTESDRLARGVDHRLSEIPGVQSVTRRTGRAERDEHAEPVSSSEIEVTMKPGVDQDAVREAIDHVLAAVPGITTMVGQPIEHRLSHMLSGTPAAIAINVFGEDLAVLRRIAQRVEEALDVLPGVRDVSANREVLITSLSIRYRPMDLAAAGLTPSSAAEQVRAALHGERVAVINQGVRRYDLVVRLAEDERARIEQVRDFRLRGVAAGEGRAGPIVRLRDVADVGPERVSNLIARENAQRKAVISANVAQGHNLGQLVERVREVVDPIVREVGGPGYFVQYGGQFEAQRSASRSILLMGLGVTLVMFLLLQASTGRARVALLVMLNLPLALIGGVVAIYLADSPSVLRNSLALFGLGGAGNPYVAPVVSIASLVGFITLFGISVRNGILLVNHYEHLHTREGRSVREAIVQGSSERLVPILMTALTAALGLLPLAFAQGKPGSELLAPLAVVVLGGLISSTFLNLFVVPAGYALAFGVRFARDAGPGGRGAMSPPVPSVATRDPEVSDVSDVSNKESTR
ncbi:MAG: efflux RND transporter permease subunit [Phycisphaeraceae bacterium]|nr:efflux RND transporter permease subunit [Phycisphaeraceae bacterium]